MIIGIPKEIMHGEGRVSAIPETVAKLKADGFEVLDKIAAAKTGRMGYFSDVPRETIVIDRMEVVEE